MALLYIYYKLLLAWLLVQVELLMASDDYNDMKPHRIIVVTRVLLVGENIWQNVTPYCAPFNGKYEHVSVVMRN